MLDKSGRMVDRALLFCALQADFADFSVVCFVSLIYPLPYFGPMKATLKLKVLGHGHVFEVWILISSGSDIDSNAWFWSDLIGQQLGAPYTEPADCIQGTIYRSWDTLGTVAAVLSLLQDFVHISLAADTS